MSDKCPGVVYAAGGWLEGQLENQPLFRQLMLGKLLAWPTTFYLKSVLTFLNAAVDL